MKQKSNELKVKYHNDLNCIKTTKLSEVDLNVFFSLCAKAKEKNATEIEIDFDKFLEISGLQNKSTVNTRKKMIDFIDKKYEILHKLEYKRKTDKSIVRFPLINKLTVEEDEDTIKLRIDEDFLYILNTESDFTKFILANFISINGKYSKNLYRLLMRYEDTGWADYGMDDFKDYMGIPKGYRPKDITEKIIKPSIEELKNKGLMSDVRCEIKKSRRQGNEIKGFHFEFEVCVNDEKHGQLSMDDYKKANKLIGQKTKLNQITDSGISYSDIENDLLDN